MLESKLEECFQRQGVLTHGSVFRESVCGNTKMSGDVAVEVLLLCVVCGGKKRWANDSEGE